MICPSAALDVQLIKSPMQHTDSSKPEAMRDTLNSCRGAPVVSGVDVDVDVDVDVGVDAKNL